MASLLLLYDDLFKQQVVQFMTNSTSIDPDQLPYKLNSLLPHDIRVIWMSRTAPDFNVTVSALRKVSDQCRVGASQAWQRQV
jgi:hypothetical protein